MKKLYILLALLSISFGPLHAQYSGNRTPKTIVADVLAQMPARDAQQFETLTGDLASAGEEGVLLMIQMMVPPGEGSNAAVEYALSGLSRYVTAEGQQAARLAVSSAYVKALGMVQQRETKAFIIRQLETAGGAEAVPGLSAYLSDEQLSGPASRALASIGKRSPEAAEALLAALGRATSDKSKEDIVTAIAEIGLSQAEPELTRMLHDARGQALEGVLLYALGQCGSKASLGELAAAARRSGYTMEKTGATASYIALIRRVMEQGEVKEAQKAAQALAKAAGRAHLEHLREAALGLQMAAEPADALEMVQKALKDGSREYRCAALNFASDYAGEPFYAGLIQTFGKAPADTRIDIMNWLAQQCTDKQKQAAISSFGIAPFTADLASADFALKSAAAALIARIGGTDAAGALAGLLASGDPQTVSLAGSLLSTVPGDISAPVAAIIPSAGDAGKTAALRLLSNRKASAYFQTVMGQIDGGSPEVKQAAYSALKNVVTADNLPVLYDLLENAAPQDVAALQQAIGAAVKGIAPDKRLATLTGQMDATPKEKQYLYYPILTATGIPGSLEIVTDRFAKESGTAKDAAFQALLDWQGHQTAGLLLNICKDPSASRYFDRALARYITLASDPALTGENRRLLLANALEIAKTDGQKNLILKNLGGTDSYPALLLSGGYLDQPALRQAAAGAVMNIALNNKEFTGPQVRALLEKVIEVLDNPDAGYQKEAIRKHLNEMPEGEGFVSIFNGKDLAGWQGLVENPVKRSKMTKAELARRQAEADKQAAEHWTAAAGVLVFDGKKGGDNLCTVHPYGDFEMLVDWQLDPAGPEPDAGIYLRASPQVQIWDTARTNVGAQVGSGGLYNNQQHPSVPLALADNPLGEWNAFYIKMTGDRVTVKLNGILVVDNVILENYWDRSKPIFPREQIELQAHGSKVYYRNIYIKELASPEPFELSEQEKKEGFRILFDGTNMHDWTGNTVDYLIDQGTISLDPKGRHGGNLYTKDEFSDFIYRFEFLLTPAANNGVGIRTPMGVDAAYHGMEIQILDHDHPVYKNITPLQVHGSVYGIIGAERGHLRPVGEWNEEEIIADGDHIKVTLNGVVILDGNIREATVNGTADGQEHPGLFNKTGRIGFLGHGSAVKFRNIRIKEIDKK